MDLSIVIPSNIDELITLPGIGKNTAHAIATFAFKQPVPVMEANVKRILCRLHQAYNTQWIKNYGTLRTH